jgi:glycosyltransferase involved in cell wall biosynthesis
MSGSLISHHRKSPRIVIVHDALCVAGGAERMSFWMAKAFPGSPIFTSVYLPSQTFSEFQTLDVRTLPLARFIRTERQFKLLYPFWLFELRRIQFAEYDQVLSSSTYLAKFIRPGSEVDHKAYLHAPFRLLWKPESYSEQSLPIPRIVTPLLKALLPSLRVWDKKNTQKIGNIATNSLNTAGEIKRFYQKSAQVIHPPVPLADYPLADTPGDYFLTVSRLISHKRVDLAIEACNRLKLELLVVGEGPERLHLEQLAGKTIHFKGRVSDKELKRYYLNSKALIFPSHEDFGIVPLESQACGRPVIAYRKGGVLETVKEGESGLFFQYQTVESIVAALKTFQGMDFSPDQIRKWTGPFDVGIFYDEIRKFVNQA